MPIQSASHTHAARNDRGDCRPRRTIRSRADGVVDLYLLPANDDIASLRLLGGAWKLNHAFRGSAMVAGIKMVESMVLDEESLNRVFNEIAAHAA